ncbi:hypothetical protein [Micromonospora sp. NPDC005652]|uniref:hypothetical protein n=1 Tax=Micromonospora sp. NPDC005652 TaxID=3157046 RepID=UPI0033E52D0F
MARFTASQLEARRASRQADPYEYEGSDGRVYAFKAPKQLHLKKLKDLRGGDIHENLLSLLGQEQFDAFLELPEADLEMIEILLQDYNAHHGVAEPGE